MQLSFQGQIMYSVCVHAHAHIFCKGVFTISMEEKHISPGSLAVCATYAKALHCFGSKQRQKKVRELIDTSIVVVKRKARLGHAAL